MEKCRVLPTGTPELFAAAVQEAATLLRAGEVVALPTETVYGLAANALNAEAVGRIFKIKGRPVANPIIVHVDSFAMARDCVAEWPPIADRLASAFWPGPLTLVLPRSRKIPDLVTAGGETVAVRWPRHAVIDAVIRACGFPLAAPSANLSGAVSPTNAGHVARSLEKKISLVLDGGPARIGIESTVLDLTSATPKVLRPGLIHAESLAALTGGVGIGQSHQDATLRSPGLLPKHYSPKARLVVWSWHDEADLKSQISNLKIDLRSVNVIAHRHIPTSTDFGQVCVLPRDAAGFGQALYAEWHRCDERGAKLIVMEAPPTGVEWQAIADRLLRASAN